MSARVCEKERAHASQQTSAREIYMQLELPAVESELDGQLRHEAAPAPALYLPARHCVQVPPSDPEEPALQIHDIKAELPAGELE